MVDYQKLAIKKYPALPGRQTAESRYWRKFKFPVIVKEYAAVSCVDFCPVAPYDFAVTSSTRVQIYSAKTNTVRKTISRFKEVAHGGRFRKDGKLLVAGDDSGLVQVFDLASRTILRSLRNHQGPVHATGFSPNNIHVFSAADDRTLRCYDLPTGSQLHCFDEHRDYIRSAQVSLDNPDLWFSGSYDHTIKLWDLRTGQSTMSINHNAPVEAILIFPGDGLIASAGGNTLKIWDILSGGRLLHSLSNHQKTITSLCFDSAYSRILTGSLDYHVKIYNMADYKVTHSVKYSAPILSIGLSPDDTHLVAGMSNGLLSIRQRPVKTEELSKLESAKKGAHGGTYRYFIRGKNEKPSEEDHLVNNPKKPKLKKYDTYLRKFQYKNALDDAIQTNQSPVVVFSLLEELTHRDGLKIALSGRDEKTLEPILVFLMKNITNPRYTSLLIRVVGILLDIYTPVIGQSMVIDELFVKLQGKLKQEIAFQKQMMQVLGMLDMIFANSNKQNISVFA